MDDKTPTDSDNVVSLDQFRASKQYDAEEIKLWEPDEGLLGSLISEDYDLLLEKMQGLLSEIREDDMPTYRDWCSLSAVLAILSDTTDHLFANQAVQYEDTLFKASVHIRDALTAMQDYTKTYTDPIITEEE